MEIAIMTAEPMVFKLPETMKIEECLPLDQFIRTTPDCTIHLDGLNVQEFSGLAAQTAAVELLINRLLQSGAERRNLQAKSFGGACMTEHANDIDSGNATFAKGFLKKEGIPCVSSSLGGVQARRVQFIPTLGAARQLQIAGVVPDEIRPVKQPRPRSEITSF
ncbi:MAG: hypothetical protein ACJAZ1_000769 [Yoonia sp.]|jgi:hypothetical protein